MESNLRQVMQDYIAALDHHAQIDTEFADRLTEMAGLIAQDVCSVGMSDALMAMARMHRVGAIKARAQMAGVSAEYDARFGTGNMTDRL